MSRSLNKIILGFALVFLVLGCKKTESKSSSELLKTKEILETFISNPSDDFYTNCLLQQAQPIKFKNWKNYEIVKEVLLLDDITFNEQIESSKAYSIPDTLFPKLNIISQKKLDSLNEVYTRKNASKIYNDLNCLNGLLSVTNLFLIKIKPKLL